MKLLLTLFLCLAMFKLASAAFSSDARFYASKPEAKERLFITAGETYDACFDQYNNQSQINEWMFGYMLYNCYEVLQFPYSTQCHSEAILNWSSAQDVIFEQFMYCQNGNSGKVQAIKK